MSQIEKEEKSDNLLQKIKGETRRKPIGFAMKPLLTKHRQRYTRVIICCYHQSMLL